jgi:hypothetical protein
MPNSFANRTAALSLQAQKVGDMGVCLTTAVALYAVGLPQNKRALAKELG